MRRTNVERIEVPALEEIVWNSMTVYSTISDNFDDNRLRMLSAAKDYDMAHHENNRLSVTSAMDAVGTWTGFYPIRTISGYYVEAVVDMRPAAVSFPASPPFIPALLRRPRPLLEEMLWLFLNDAENHALVKMFVYHPELKRFVGPYAINEELIDPAYSEPSVTVKMGRVGRSTGKVLYVAYRTLDNKLAVRRINALISISDPTIYDSEKSIEGTPSIASHRPLGEPQENIYVAARGSGSEENQLLFGNLTPPVFPGWILVPIGESFVSRYSPVILSHEGEMYLFFISLDSEYLVYSKYYCEPYIGGGFTCSWTNPQRVDELLTGGGYFISRPEDEISAVSFGVENRTITMHTLFRYPVDAEKDIFQAQLDEDEEGFLTGEDFRAVPTVDRAGEDDAPLEMRTPGALVEYKGRLYNIWQPSAGLLSIRSKRCD